MTQHPDLNRRIRLLMALAALWSALLACARSQPGDGGFWSISNRDLPTAAVVVAETTPAPWEFASKRTPGGPILTPTPDKPHEMPALRTHPDQYTVAAGDTLGQIASRYGVTIEQIVQENELANPNMLEIGQALTIPVPTPQTPGPNFKIIPDSELVYGPYSVLFNVEEFVGKTQGYLASYKEEVDERSLSGAQIVQRTAQDYSVNPRLLLAMLQHQSQWLTNPQPNKAGQEYPLGLPDPQRKGLYRQLSWAANSLNRGYYLWRSGSIAAWILADGSIIPVAPTINPGTAAVQQLFALLNDRATWEKQVSPDGFFATYNAMFGYPFDFAIEPLLPDDLFQPPMQLPFEAGEGWYFTGGPHSGWGDGSAWAALDFAPPGGALGCVENNAWVTAVADGLVLRAENGAVIQDLDGDGLEQTGWVVLYMHVESRGRVQPGTYLKTGERVGHPSCEGGVSNGTHLHLARRYNGQWIAAGYGIPFVMDGWIASSTGNEYDGYLTRGGTKLEAYAGIDDNGIQR